MVADITALDVLFTLLVACALKGGFFLLVVAWIAFSSSSASQRHFVWTLGMVVMLAMFTAEGWIPQWQVLPSLTPIVGVVGWIDHLAEWLVILWGIGVALGLARMVLGMVSLVQLERNAAPVEDQEWVARLTECREKMGLKSQVRLLMHPGQIMPMTWGLMRHFIVLPATAWRWSGNRGRAVLMHELAHIRRRDFFARVIRDLTMALFWFHPLVWLASREMEEDREEASDDAVLASGHQPLAYAEHLAAVATHRPDIQSSLAFARRPLVQRVRNILNPWKSRHPLMPRDRFRVAFFLIFVGAVTLAFGFRGSSGLPSGREAIALDPVDRSGVAISGIPSSSWTSVGDLVGGLGASPRTFELTDNRWEPSATGIEPVESRIQSEPLKPEELSHSVIGQELSGGPIDLEDASSIKIAAIDSGGIRSAEVPMFPRAVYMRPDPDVPLPAPEVEVPDETTPPEEPVPAPNPPPVVEPSESDILPFLENVLLGVGFDPLDSEDDETETLQQSAQISGYDFSVQALVGQIPMSQSGLLPALPGVEERLTRPGSMVGRNETAVKSNENRGDSSGKASGSGSEERDSDGALLRPAPPHEEPVPDPLLTEVGLIMEPTVVRGPTGETHLAIRFMRAADSIPASFLFLASKDLREWSIEAELFFLADVRRGSDGRQEVTIGLTEAIDESEFRYMRIRVKRL